MTGSENVSTEATRYPRLRIAAVSLSIRAAIRAPDWRPARRPLAAKSGASRTFAHTSTPSRP
jgi:hypothetical protein